MKKKRIIVLLIIGLLVLAVISCRGPKDSQEAPADTETTQTEETAEPEAESEAEDADSAILSPDFKKNHGRLRSLVRSLLRSDEEIPGQPV